MNEGSHHIAFLRHLLRTTGRVVFFSYVLQNADKSEGVGLLHEEDLHTRFYLYS